MNIEEFSFDLDEKSVKNLKKAIGYDEIEARHKRFMNGTETIDDLINGVLHYQIKNADGLDLDVVDFKYYKKIIDLYEKEKEKNKELDKENQGLFELYNFNDSSLLAKILKDYKAIIEKQQKEIERLEARKYILNAETGEISQIPIDNNYISKDKIKSKIEDYKKEQEFYNKNEDRESGQYSNWDWIDSFINELQSLLEKE